MIGEEEKVLRNYLVYVQRKILSYSEFDEWYETIRDGSDAGEQEYKQALNEAKIYERGFKDGEARAKKHARFQGNSR